MSTKSQPLFDDIIVLCSQYSRDYRMSQIRVSLWFSYLVKWFIYHLFEDIQNDYSTRFLSTCHRWLVSDVVISHVYRPKINFLIVKNNVSLCFEYLKYWISMSVTWHDILDKESRITSLEHERPNRHRDTFDLPDVNQMLPNHGVDYKIPIFS